MPLRTSIYGLTTLAVLIMAGFVLGDYPLYLLCGALINIIIAVGLNLLTGNSGQISLCHASFVAVGAYVTALLTAFAHVNFILAMPIAAAVCAIIGILIGFPAARLRGIYLAVATLGVLQLVQFFIEEFPELTGGVRGLSVTKSTMLAIAPLGQREMYAVILIMTVTVVWIAWNLLRSRVIREFNAVRISPVACQALGIDVAKVKLVAFALSAAYAGLAGGLIANLVGFIDPVEFGLSATLRYITFIVVGGMGSLLGSIIGALTLSALPELLRPVKEWSDFIYAAILLGFVFFLPDGIVGTARKIWRKRLSVSGKVALIPPITKADYE